LRTATAALLEPRVPEVAAAPTAAINVSVATDIAMISSLERPFNPHMQAGYATSYAASIRCGDETTLKANIF